MSQTLADIIKTGIASGGSNADTFGYTNRSAFPTTQRAAKRGPRKSVVADWEDTPQEDAILEPSSEDSVDDSYELDAKIYGSGSKQYVIKGTDPELVKKNNTPKRKQQNPSRKNTLLNQGYDSMRSLILSELHEKITAAEALVADYNRDLELKHMDYRLNVQSKLKDLRERPNKKKEKEEPKKDLKEEKSKKKDSRNNDRRQNINDRRPNQRNNDRRGGKKNDSKNKNAKKEKEENKKVVVTFVDEEGYVNKVKMSEEEAKEFKENRIVERKEIKEHTPNFREEAPTTKKKKAKTVNNSQLMSQNPFEAILGVGEDFETKLEGELIKSQNKNKKKEVKPVQKKKKKQKKKPKKKQQPKKEVVVQQTNNRNVTQKPKNTNKGGAKKNKAQKKKKAQKKEEDINAKIKKKQEAGYKKRQERDAKRFESEAKKAKGMLSNHKMLEKVGKHKKNQQWYEHEYIQPAMIAAAGVLLLAFLYSFINMANSSTVTQ